MESVLAARQRLRREISNLRQLMTLSQVEAGSNSIVGKLNELPAIKQAHNIMVFAAIQNEVNLTGAIAGWMQAGKKVLLPRVVKTKGLEAVEFSGWENTVSSSFGVKEPIGNAFDPEQIGAVIVPGLVFDYKGYRLGYGKGYYDGFLPKLGIKAFICGVGFDFQLVETIYPQPHDVPVHWIVTDKSELVVSWDYF